MLGMRTERIGEMRGVVSMQKKRKSIAGSFLILAMAAGIVAACWYFGIGTTSSGWRIGYVDNAGKHHWSARYVQFDGTMKRTMYAEDGVNLLHIEVNTTEGSLGVTVKNVGGEVIFSEPNMENQTFDIETLDQVIVELEGQKHKGSFSLHYRPITPPEPIKPEGLIFLYGEEHSSEPILEEEFKRWEKYYKEDGMRHLFVEMPYYATEFLNIWMQEKDNKILNELYADWQGTAVHSEQVRRFYHKIKEHCPETVFHGTDVGHEYATTGARYLNYLRAHKMENTEAYQLTMETIEQGKRYYETMDDAYRENMMTENFIRVFDTLKGVNVMGIYGSAHLSQEVMDTEGNFVPCMTSQLKEHYGDSVQAEDLTMLARNIEPSRTDRIQVAGKEYEALYFGTVDLSTFAPEFRYREFWRLENAYPDFQKYEKTNNVLPYDNFPMRVEQGQVIVVDYVKADDTVIRQYYRTDGTVWHGAPAAQEIWVTE